MSPGSAEFFVHSIVMVSPDSAAPSSMMVMSKSFMSSPRLHRDEPCRYGHPYSGSRHSPRTSSPCRPRYRYSFYIVCVWNLDG